MNKKSVSILGCGWLGLPLAKRLVKEGYEVKGSTTTPDKIPLLKESGIEPFIISLDPAISGQELERFFSSDILFINVPPQSRTKPDEWHKTQMKSLYDYMQRINAQSNIIFASSTSVYPDKNGIVTEEEIFSEENSGHPGIAFAERLFSSGVILRLGGLAGADRMFIKYFAGKKNLDGGNSPVNFLHRDDAVEVIVKIIESDFEQEVFNVCSPLHPVRKDFYERLAVKYGYEIPEYKEEERNGKEISVDKLQRVLKYNFIHEDPHEYTYEKN